MKARYAVDESVNNTDNNKQRQKPQTSALAIASFILSLLAILAVILSIHRIETIQSLPVCLIAETPMYRLVHSLCIILPTGSLAAGIVALIRMLRSHSRLWGIILAAGGIAVSLTVLVLYWFNLTRLASEYLY